MSDSQSRTTNQCDFCGSDITLDAGNDAPSNTVENLSASNNCIQFGCTYAFIILCINTIIAGTGNSLVAGNADAFNTFINMSAPNACIQFGCMYACFNCCFNNIIEGTESTVDAGNDAASNICKLLGCI